MNNKQAAAIREAVDQNFEAQVAFTAALVRFASLRGQEHTAQDFMAKAFAERQLGVDRWRIDIDDIKHLRGFSPVTISYDNAINVVGVHRSDAPTGRSLILNGHIDVVPEGPHEMWRSPPYEARREGDWLYGRGAGDMKAGLVANLFAYDAIRAAGLEPAADVYLQSVIEEECTGNGALACLQRGYRADAAIIPEPSAEAVGMAQTGTIWMRITIRGWPAHAAYAQRGQNAIKAAMRLIEALERLEATWNSQKHQHPHFADHAHPLNFNIGGIRGGEWPASVPAVCSFDLRAAIFDDDDIHARAGEIEACISEAAAADSFMQNNPPEIEYNGFMAEGYALTDADEQLDVLRECHQDVHGKTLTGRYGTGTTDARFFGLYADTPAMVYGPRAENVHAFDERVNLESTRLVTQTIALFIARWCGLHETQRN